MDFKGSHRTPVSTIPKDVAEVFEETDIEKVWDYLEKTFRLNKKEWKKDFEYEYGKSSREYSKMELFVRYDKQYFQPALNRILHREEQHPTWIQLVRFIVIDKIEKLEDEKGRIARRYGRGSRYTTN